MLFSDLPGDLQGFILGYLTLRDLAQMACWSRRAHAVYLERIRKRDEVITDCLQSHFTAEFREGLFPAQLALPRDLIVTPAMDASLLAAPNIGPVRIGQYKGFCVGGVPDGRGVCEAPHNGSQYLGDWHQGDPHGQGTAVYPDGGQYDGQWKSGQRDGLGTETDPDGARYVGQWKSDQRDGLGTFIDPDGARYEGHWKLDDRDGLGTLIWPDGAQYVGEWKAGHRHGRGTFTTLAGFKYVGDWSNGTYHGKGRLEEPNGEVYVGSFVSGLRHGLGRTHTPGGPSFFGGLSLTSEMGGE